MSTGGEGNVVYSLVNVGTLKLDTNERPTYISIVICQDKIIVLDIDDTNKVNIHRLHDGKFLDMVDSDSISNDICLLDARTICILHDDGLIEMASIKSEDMSPVFTRMKSFSLHGVFDFYENVHRVNDSIVVVGTKQDTMYWCIASLDDGHVDTIHQICKSSGWSYVTTKDNIIYISCYAGVDDTGVYAFDILNPSQYKYNYKHQSLRYPRSIVINEDGNIFVCNYGLVLGYDSCIHQLTASCQLVAIFTQGIPWNLQAMFWDNGRLYVACRWSPEITVFRHVYQDGSHKHSELLTSHEENKTIIVETYKEIEQGNFLTLHPWYLWTQHISIPSHTFKVEKGQSSEEMETHPSKQMRMDYGDDKDEGSHKYSEVLKSHEKLQSIIVETSKEIEQGNVEKGQSSEDMETHPSKQMHMDYGDDKDDNLTEDKICQLLSSESVLKAYISDDPSEACIKKLLSQASKQRSKESMKIILHCIVQQFTERFSEKHIRIWAGEKVIGPANVEIVFVCFYSGSCDQSLESFYDLKVIYRDYNTTDGESASARARELEIKSDLTPEQCDLVNEAITIHGKGLFAKHSNLEAISSSGILSSNSRGFVQDPCVILYCRVKGIIPYGEMPFPKSLKVNEEVSIAVDVREGYFSSHADSNPHQENTVHQLNEPLRMGGSIGPAGRCVRGTIGPFVKINSDRIGFLTCAHVVFCDIELIHLANITQTNPIVKEIVQPPDGDSTAKMYQYNHRLCGKVLHAMYCGDWRPSPTETWSPSPAETSLAETAMDWSPSTAMDWSPSPAETLCPSPAETLRPLPAEETFGIDAAVIEITSRFPNAGAFVPIAKSQLEDAGFSLDQPPTFDKGEMMQHPINRRIRGAVIKIGSETGLTLGHLKLAINVVKYSGFFDKDRPSIIMYGLMQISSARFCDKGDSGAGVFIVDDNDNRLKCVGLLNGFISDGTGTAMPIDKVLTALHCGDDLQIKLKEF